MRIAAGVVPQSSWTLSPAAPASICSTSGAVPRRVALAEDADVDRQTLEGPQHHRDVPGPGVMVVPLVPSVGPMPPPNSVVTPLRQRGVRLLRRDEVDVRVDARRREDQVLAGDRVGRRADARAPA